MISSLGIHVYTCLVALVVSSSELLSIIKELNIIRRELAYEDITTDNYLRAIATFSIIVSYDQQTISNSVPVNHCPFGFEALTPQITQRDKF